MRVDGGDLSEASAWSGGPANGPRWWAPPDEDVFLAQLHMRSKVRAGQTRTSM